MVSRKPVAHSQGVGSAPYPVSPVTSDNPSDFPVQNTQSTRVQPRLSGAEDTNEWSLEGNHGHGNTMAEVPEALRVGPPGGVKPRPSQEVMKNTALNTNPFLQKQSTGKSTEAKESSAGAWDSSEEYPKQPSGQPPPPPVTITQGMFLKDLLRSVSNLPSYTSYRTAIFKSFGVWIKHKSMAAST